MSTMTIRHTKDIASGMTDDPFHDPALGGVAFAFVILGLVILVLTGLLIWGVEYRTPSWNANSYPPPIAHRW
jgi:thiosulfate reductase cytochrome b subunit